jgi:hypothetical protein
MEEEYKLGDTVMVKDLKDQFWVQETLIAFNDIGPYKYVTVDDKGIVTGWMEIRRCN